MLKNLGDPYFKPANGLYKDKLWLSFRAAAQKIMISHALIAK